MSAVPPPPKPALQSLDEALARLLQDVTPWPEAQAESLPTWQSLGRILVAPLTSTLDVPPADNTSMDGYAVRCADVTGAGCVLPVSQRIAAGDVGVPLAPGTAARIFTGAQLPPGADAVVMQEHCEAVPQGVRILAVPRAGLWVRRRGEDVRRGDTVLGAGARLTPGALGLAATVGAATLRVARRPRVALISTGNELVMPGQPLPPGAIYNSNRYTLHSALQALGCECEDLGIVPDRLDATREMLRRAAAGNDVVVTSGGVSVGEEDHLRPAAQAEGRIAMWQIAIKPGKPFAFGDIRRADGSRAHLVGLPGNPVASFLTFFLMVRPLLLRLQGATQLALPRLRQRADFEWPRPDARREFLRVRHNGSGGLELFANQGSGVLSSVVWADGVVDNPPGQAIRVGDPVDFVPFAEMLN
jgi:molybdopterin molybdotransferase